MSRWGKNIVVPLDSLCKEKENTNRPTVARSVGTVGKWGKMGFTSTRTYTLSVLPAAVAAAAAAAAASTSPGQSPVSALDDDLSPSVPEPPKPKKFFKSRNAAPPEVIAQIIQQLPRTPTSPSRDSASATMPNYLSTPVQGREPIKLKIPKTNSAERKKKSAKKLAKSGKSTATDDDKNMDKIPQKPPPSEPKSKKKKEEKKLKPEAPPSRVISRARKAINYCEYDDDDRQPTPVKDIVAPKSKLVTTESTEKSPTDNADAKSINVEPVLPPPALPGTANSVIAVGAGSGSGPSPASNAPKTPEHPPIVLRISKGTSRLVSTDSEEQSPNTAASPPQPHDTEPINLRHASTEEVPVAPANSPAILPTTPKIIVKPPKPPSPKPSPTPLLNSNDDEPPEINYCTVKISPDKPPKERLKLIIKTDVIRNAIAAAAAAAAAKAAAAAEKAASAEAAGADGERPEKEKKLKSKKHKHLKHTAVEQLSSIHVAVGSEFKTPSPHLALGASGEHHPATARTVISPPALSERDFDSQSSVLGSISSKGNSTPKLLAQTVQEESCVIHSRGSSVITSDLETSQHSSLVAPPSDIESRLESMMMDGDVSQRATNMLEEEPLQEDILAVLRGGDESQSSATEVRINGRALTEEVQELQSKSEEQTKQEVPKKRVTRARGRTAPKVNNAGLEVDAPQKPQAAGKTTRARKPAQPVNQIAEEAPAIKRGTRRSARKAEDSSTIAMEVEDASTKTPAKEVSPSKSEEENTPIQPSTQGVSRRGRSARNASNNNNLSNNNNNINKIAANLSAKAGAAEDTKCSPTNSAFGPNAQATTARNYGRKRKNQQVTQVLQPAIVDFDDPQEGSTPAKLANLDLSSAEELASILTTASTTTPSPTYQHSKTPTMDLNEDGNSNSNSNSLTRPSSTTPSSPRRDYKVKDKFKRTLMLDNQVNCHAVVASPTASLTGETTGTTNSNEDEQQRGSVKLVISKKNSIFKSRALVPPEQSEQSTLTKRHLYKHRWDAEANGATPADRGSLPTNSSESQNTPTSRSTSDSIFDDFSEDLSAGTRDNSPVLGKLTRATKPNPQVVANPFDMDTDSGPSDSVSSIKVDRKAKEYYTVVRNVKTAHQIQEIGEYQEMDDDVEYILDALQPHNPTPTRCLSALQLATKCMTPAFRMHVRAHGVVIKFFKALSDANTDLSLGLCTSAIMYILSQEGLNVDLDCDSLELMMNLLKAEGVAAPSDRANYERNKQKVRELCEEIKAQGKGTHLNVDSITVGTLAMETLLSLTSKRAGEWFKEELRKLGGLEHIINTIADCCRPVIECRLNAEEVSWTQPLLDNMKTVERCMRVLENVTQMNEENQKYILTFSKGAFLETLCTLYRLCDHEIQKYPATDISNKESSGTVMRELLVPVMKVLINLTHTFNPSNAFGAETIGQQADIIDVSFHLLLQAPNYIPERCVFELSILVLLLLINLTMHTVPNRILVMKAKAPSESDGSKKDNDAIAVQAVMEYFYKCEELARLVEKNTDAILDNADKNKKKQEEVEETVNNLLQKAGHHMEHTLKGSYAAILIGYLITDSEEHETTVRKYLRGHGFKELVTVLEKYYTFMNLTASSEASVVSHIKSTKKLIDYFKKCDLVFEMKESDNFALPLNLETNPENTTTTSNNTPPKDASSPTSTTTPTPIATTSTTRSTQRVYKTYSQR